MNVWQELITDSKYRAVTLKVRIEKSFGQVYERKITQNVDPKKMNGV